MSQILTFILYFALFQSCTKVVSFKCISNINRICEMFDPSCDLMFVGRGAEINLLYNGAGTLYSYVLFHWYAAYHLAS